MVKGVCGGGGGGGAEIENSGNCEFPTFHDSFQGLF